MPEPDSKPKPQTTEVWGVFTPGRAPASDDALVPNCDLVAAFTTLWVAEEQVAIVPIEHRNGVFVGSITLHFRDRLPDTVYVVLERVGDRGTVKPIAAYPTPELARGEAARNGLLRSSLGLPLRTELAADLKWWPNPQPLPGLGLGGPMGRQLWPEFVDWGGFDILGGWGV